MLPGPWSAPPGSRSRLDFAGSREVPWSPRRAAGEATTRGRRLGERPWYIDFFDATTRGDGLELQAVHRDLDGGPLELDSSFLVTVSARAAKGIS